jgi:hypothetical protein
MSAQASTWAPASLLHSNLPALRYLESPKSTENIPSSPSHGYNLRLPSEKAIDGSRSEKVPGFSLTADEIFSTENTDTGYIQGTGGHIDLSFFDSSVLLNKDAMTYSHSMLSPEISFFNGESIQVDGSDWANNASHTGESNTAHGLLEHEETFNDGVPNGYSGVPEFPTEIQPFSQNSSTNTLFESTPSICLTVNISGLKVAGPELEEKLFYKVKLTTQMWKLTEVVKGRVGISDLRLIHYGDHLSPMRKFKSPALEF